MIQNSAGFTLLELIIVIILMGILSLGIYLNWPGYVITLASQADQFAHDLRYTQSLAMTRGQRYRLVGTSGNSYQIQNSAGAAIMLAQGTTTMTFKSGVSFGTITNLPNSVIVFDGKGVPYIDTGIPGTPLNATASIALIVNSDTKTITVSPETGRVNVQ